MVANSYAKDQSGMIGVNGWTCEVARGPALAGCSKGPRCCLNCKSVGRECGDRRLDGRTPRPAVESPSNRGGLHEARSTTRSTDFQAFDNLEELTQRTLSCQLRPTKLASQNEDLRRGKCGRSPELCPHALPNDICESANVVSVPVCRHYDTNRLARVNAKALQVGYRRLIPRALIAARVDNHPLSAPEMNQNALTITGTK